MIRYTKETMRAIATSSQQLRMARYTKETMQAIATLSQPSKATRYTKETMQATATSSPQENNASHVILRLLLVFFSHFNRFEANEAVHGVPAFSYRAYRTFLAALRFASFFDDVFVLALHSHTDTRTTNKFSDVQY